MGGSARGAVTLVLSWLCACGGTEGTGAPTAPEQSDRDDARGATEASADTSVDAARPGEEGRDDAGKKDGTPAPDDTGAADSSKALDAVPIDAVPLDAVTVDGIAVDGA